MCRSAIRAAGQPRHSLRSCGSGLFPRLARHRREHLGLDGGHRTLVITRKGGKVVTIPLASRTARAIDLATGERTEGPLFVTADGNRLDRHGAARIVRGSPAAPGSASTHQP